MGPIGFLPVLDVAGFGADIAAAGRVGAAVVMSSPSAIAVLAHRHKHRERTGGQATCGTVRGLGGSGAPGEGARA
jgi:hypothetical protein